MPNLFKKEKLFTFIFLLLSWSNLSAQSTLGGKIGLLLNFGQPVNRIGVDASLFVVQQHLQATLACKTYYNFTNFGIKKGHWEVQSQLGLQGAWSKIDEDVAENPFYYTYFNRSFFRYSLGYQFQYYWNMIGTKQSSGTINLQLNNWYIRVENDAFGNLKGKDRFRTGAFSVAYQKEELLVELKSVMWTGETRGNKLQVCKEPNDYPCRWGYKDISKLPYGKTSHGVAAVQIHYALPYRQAAHLDLGIDSEHIRNFLQNKVIHDMYFLPTSWVKTKNLHYPMLDKNGMPYLYQADQEIRKNRWFWQVGLNNNDFY